MLRKILLCITLLLLPIFTGCLEDDPATRVVKIEVVKCSGVPEKAKIVIEVVGGGSSTIDLPGSKEFKIIAREDKSVNVNITRHSLSDPFDLNSIQGNIKVYVDGSQIDYTEAPGVESYFLEFKVKKAPPGPAENPITQ